MARQYILRGRLGVDHADGKKRIENRAVNEIELRLKRIEKFMQPLRNDLPRVGICQLRPQLTKPLLGGIAVHANRSA